MKMDIINGEKLKIEAETPAEAFALGELWGAYADYGNLAYTDDATLIFDLAKPRKTEPQIL